MKFIFFLIPFLVLSVSLIPDSFAEIKKGLNYNDELVSVNSDGSQIRKWTSQPERVLINDQYFDFRFINGADFLSVETGHGSVVLNKNTCSFDFYKKGIIQGEPLFSDSIVVKMATNGTENWSVIPQINNAICEASGNENQLVAKKFTAGVGLLEYKYINTGSTWKTQLEAINLSGQTNKKFGFTQTINLNRDTIHYDGMEKNLDNFADTTFNRNWLVTHESKIINFLNDISFDFDLGFDNLKSIDVYDTGINKSKLAFNYLYDTKILLPNETIIMDPTYSSNNPTVDGNIEDTNDDNVCNGTTLTKTTNGVSIESGPDSTADGIDCDRGFFEYDISSIPVTATITDSDFKFEVISLEGTPYNCVFVGMTNQPSVASDANIWSAISGGTSLVTDSSCTTTGINKSVDLSTLGDTYIDTQLSSGWAAIGVKGATETLDGSYHMSRIYSEESASTPDPTLEITYMVISPPWGVTTLTNPSETTTTESLDWTAPYAGGGNQYIIGYQINKTSPWGTPNIILVNDTGTTTTDYIATLLTPGTQYSFRVSAWTNNTGNHPYNNATGNILNVTTPLNIYGSVAPTNLVVYPVICDPAKLNLQWSAGSMQNINGYRIQRETPIGGGFSTIVSNTTTTTTYYNNTGLVANNNYNYRVYSLNGSGISAASDTYAHYTCHLPNAVTDLTGIATSLSTIELDWTAPIAYSTILGYMINYTTPEGTPLTIFDPPHTGSTTTAATVTGLGIGIDYSFRVSAVTVFGSNGTGNIFNATTTTTYVLGDLPSPDVTNLDDFLIFYNRTNYNATRIYLDVTYPDSYDMDCNFLFKFSRANQTYNSLAGTPITGPGADTDNERYRFTIDGANDEIINVRCWDTITDDEAKYIITITDFELLNQIDNLHNGTYGTMGQIGGLDIVVLIVVIVGMIGFNRVTPIAGVIFTIITVGALSVLGIIQTYQIIFPFLAMVVLWAYTRTRQD